MGRASVLFRIAVLATLYFATAKLGIELSVAQGVVTPVWIPTGLSLAALLVFGYRLWPGVTIGAFLANATSDVSLIVASGIAVGNTLEALVGTYLLRRFGFHNSLSRVRDVLVLTLLGGLVATTIAATNGSTVLLLSGEITSADYFSRWSLWWFGDAMGALLVAPMLLVLLSRASLPTDARRWMEGVGLLVLLVGASIFVFVGGNWKYPYLLFPLLIWSTLRFRQFGSTGTIFVISAIAIWGTVQGSVPIGGATPTESVQILQALLVVVGVSLYVLAASLDERDLVSHALEEANVGLAEAQRMAKAGSWEWDIGTNTVAWSEEMYRIYGYPSDTPLSFETAMERVHEADATRIRANIENTFAAKESNVPVIEYRVVANGEERFLRGSGVIYYADGLPIRMVGTVQDITEQKYLEQQRQLVADAKMRHRQALSLNDDIVQGLAAAKAALELDLPEKHQQLVSETLEKARQIVSSLLEEAARTRPLQPGDFTRPSEHS